jgi:hypothetical protein
MKREFLRRKKAAFLLVFASLFASVSAAWAVWTPLITSTDFDGIRTDLLTTVGGIVTLLFILLGLSVLYRVFK